MSASTTLVYRTRKNEINRHTRAVRTARSDGVSLERQGERARKIKEAYENWFQTYFVFREEDIPRVRVVGGNISIDNFPGVEPPEHTTRDRYFRDTPTSMDGDDPPVPPGDTRQTTQPDPNSAYARVQNADPPPDHNLLQQENNQMHPPSPLRGNDCPSSDGEEEEEEEDSEEEESTVVDEGSEEEDDEDDSDDGGGGRGGQDDDDSEESDDTGEDFTPPPSPQRQQRPIPTGVMDSPPATRIMSRSGSIDGEEDAEPRPSPPPQRESTPPPPPTPGDDGWGPSGRSDPGAGPSPREEPDPPPPRGISDEEVARLRAAEASTTRLRAEIGNVVRQARLDHQNLQSRLDAAMASEATARRNADAEAQRRVRAAVSAAEQAARQRMTSEIQHLMRNNIFIEMHRDGSIDWPPPRGTLAHRAYQEMTRQVNSQIQTAVSNAQTEARQRYDRQAADTLRRFTSEIRGVRDQWTADLARHRSTWATEFQRQTAEVTRLTTDVRAGESLRQQLDAELARARANATQRIQTLEAELEASNMQSDALRETIQELQDTNIQFAQRSQSAQQTIADLIVRNNDLRNMRDQLSRSAITNQDELNELRRQLDDAIRANDDLRRAAQRDANDLREAARAAAERQARLDTHKRRARRYDEGPRQLRRGNSPSPPPPDPPQPPPAGDDEEEDPLARARANDRRRRRRSGGLYETTVRDLSGRVAPGTRKRKRAGTGNQSHVFGDE